MKKLFILIILWLILGFAGCRMADDCGVFTHPEITSVNASLRMDNAPEAVPVASDLRMDMLFNVRYDVVAQQLPISLPFIQTAHASCMPNPVHFYDRIDNFSLSCDKPLRGLSAGENLLTSSTTVFFRPWPEAELTSITLAQWLETVNFGSSDGVYDFLEDLGRPRNRYSSRRIEEFYNISIALLPEGTVVPAGEYTFTLTIELRSGRRFVIPFTPVAL